MKNNILDKTDELVEYIKSSKNYKKYQELSKRVKDNKEIMDIINEIKALQKKAVRKEYNHEDVTDINKEINKKLEKLNEYPIYQEMTYLEEDLNNLFILIKERLDNYISKQIN